MVGTILNAAGIVVGGIAGLTVRKQPPAATQVFFKVALGAFTVFYGLRLTWLSVNGSFQQVLKQLVVVLLSLMLGRLAGQLLRLQKASNRLGQFARAQITAVAARKRPRWSEGFNICALLFCAAPLAILGPIHDGLAGYHPPLVIKAVMDGLATMGFVALLGWGVMLSALPVFAYQGTMTLLAQKLQPFLHDHGLIDPINATGGLLIFCIALMIFEIKRIELADYLPSLIVAPLITWLWR